MRELTIEEVEFVSGGYDPYDDGEEIVVTGSRGGGYTGGYSMSYSQYQGMQSYYNSPFGGSGGSSYGGGTTATPSTQDSDGDGTPDNEDTAPNDPNEGGTIVVNGPPRMANEWSDLTWSQTIERSMLLFTMGDEILIDFLMDTNFTGLNIDDPYMTERERQTAIGVHADRASQPQPQHQSERYQIQ
jgi:hypothetical protein